MSFQPDSLEQSPNQHAMPALRPAKWVSSQIRVLSRSPKTLLGKNTAEIIKGDSKEVLEESSSAETARRNAQE